MPGATPFLPTAVWQTHWAISIDRLCFHKNDPNYNYDWRASVTSLAYSTVINASSGLLSLGINISFADKADEIAGLFVAGEASTILGAIDFCIRQASNAIIELF